MNFKLEGRALWGQGPTAHDLLDTRQIEVGFVTQ